MRWRLHLRPVFGDVLVSKVTGSDIIAYVNARREAGFANATINRTLAILRKMFSLGVELGKVKRDAVPAIKMLREDNFRTGFLSSQDRDALADACGRQGLWMRSLFECAIVLGWRHKELLNLTVKQLNLTTNTIRLEPGTTKNLQGREVPLTPTIRGLLTRCVVGKSPDDHVFSHDDGRPVRDIRKVWRKVCIEAKVPNLLFHDLRRSAARNLRNAGVAEEIIMAAGGWKTSSVFKRYSIVNTDDIADALRKLEARRQLQAEMAKQEPEAEAELIPATTSRPI